MTPGLTGAQREALREHAHAALEDRDHQGGWAEVGTHPIPLVNGYSWDWNDMRVLRDLGLLEWREEWKDVLVRPTETGWAVLRGSDRAKHAARKACKTAHADRPRETETPESPLREAV